MTTSLFSYLEYAATTLFSKRFLTIIGSSLILSFLSIWIYIVGIYSLVIYLREQFDILTIWDSISLIFLSVFLIFLLITTTIAILVRGWYAIIVPIRSIDVSKKLDIIDDIKLYKKHILTYLGYITWYGMIWITIILGYIILLILASAIGPTAWWIWGIGGIWIIVYISTRMTISWYHMLSENSTSYKTLKWSIVMTHWRVWKIFSQIFGYALIIWLCSCLIESMMVEVLSLFGLTTFANEMAYIILSYKENATALIDALMTFAQHENTSIIVGTFWFALWYSMSSVLSRAMFSIFYVRYYLDIREDYHDEHSFIKKSLLIQSSHR